MRVCMCVCVCVCVQCNTKVSTPLTFLQIFKYISSWDNTDKMTLDTMKSSLRAAYITELI